MKERISYIFIPSFFAKILYKRSINRIKSIKNTKTTFYVPFAKKLPFFQIWNRSFLFILDCSTFRAVFRATGNHFYQFVIPWPYVWQHLYYNFTPNYHLLCLKTVEWIFFTNWFFLQKAYHECMNTIITIF